MVVPGVLSRYVIGRILLAVILVSVLLVGVYTLVELIREARSLGGDYGLLQMIGYLVLTLPRRFYDIFPFAALIGTLAGLGGLAAANELVAMRAAGFDRRQLVGRVLLAVLLVLVVLMLLAELAIPQLEKVAGAQRQQARSGEIHLGDFGALWLRDGKRVMRIGHSAWVGDDQLEFGDILIYDLAEGMRPQQVVVAERASHSGESWTLFEVARRGLGEGQSVERRPQWTFDSDLSPELFTATVSRPRLLALRDLLEMRAFLKRNDLHAGPYDQALWARVFYPINVLAMVLIGLPFIFRGPRQGGRGMNVFAGVAIGLLFFVLTRLGQGISGVIPVPLWFSSLLPALLIVVLAMLLLRRI